MLAIPIPFIVSFLLIILAIVLLLRFKEHARYSCLFLTVCATTTTMVGLRWTFNWPVMPIIQPLLASLIPILAWYCFAQTHAKKRQWLSYRHLIGPCGVLLAVTTQSFWSPPLDELITSIYLAYGIALIRYSRQDTLLINVSLNHWDGVRRAGKVAGGMLLFSAIIDTSISLDFALNQGRFSLYILTLGHLILLPVLSIAVVTVSVYTPEPDTTTASTEIETADALNHQSNQTMSDAQAQRTVESLHQLMSDKLAYLDPDLTLSKISRKLTIPAKQISIAVNLVHKKNISKLINEYRIDHAKKALLASDATVTQIFMNCGFQTKSNFNREFSRITGMTPSAFRKSNNA
jgi:AraC-like DNA-binding protein